MGGSTMVTDFLIFTLLELKDCVRPSPSMLARAMDIPRTTAQGRIKMLEQENSVVGYVPWVTPHVFGSPFLIEIEIDPKEYKFHDDLALAIKSLKEYMKQCIDHALLTFYVYEKDGMVHIRAIVLTTDIEQVLNRLYREQNIARETMTSIPLKDAYGIPKFGRQSLPQTGRASGGTNS
ncbi:MAG: hypothetical protein ACTSX2_10675 [Candidatus Thorarchaeota archaeon]